MTVIRTIILFISYNTVTTTVAAARVILVERSLGRGEVRGTGVWRCEGNNFGQGFAACVIYFDQPRLSSASSSSPEREGFGCGFGCGCPARPRRHSSVRGVASLCRPSIQQAYRFTLPRVSSFRIAWCCSAEDAPRPNGWTDYCLQRPNVPKDQKVLFDHARRACVCVCVRMSSR